MATKIISHSTNPVIFGSAVRPRPHIKDIYDTADNNQERIRKALNSACEFLGTYRATQACQTEESELVQFKELEVILHELQTDMDRTREVLQVNYHKSISDKAYEIHYRTTSRLKEIERNHKTAIHRLRQAFRTQLDSAVRKVATEHMAYHGQKMQECKLEHERQLKDTEQRIFAAKKEAMKKEDDKTKQRHILMKYHQLCKERDINDSDLYHTFSTEYGSESGDLIDRLYRTINEKELEKVDMYNRIALLENMLEERPGTEYSRSGNRTATARTGFGPKLSSRTASAVSRPRQDSFAQHGSPLSAATSGDERGGATIDSRRTSIAFGRSRRGSKMIKDGKISTSETTSLENLQPTDEEWLERIQEIEDEHATQIEDQRKEYEGEIARLNEEIGVLNDEWKGKLQVATKSVLSLSKDRDREKISQRQEAILQYASMFFPKASQSSRDMRPHTAPTLSDQPKPKLPNFGLNHALNDIQDEESETDKDNIHLPETLTFGKPQQPPSVDRRKSSFSGVGLGSLSRKASVTGSVSEKTFLPPPLLLSTVAQRSVSAVSQRPGSASSTGSGTRIARPRSGAVKDGRVGSEAAPSRRKDSIQPSQ